MGHLQQTGSQGVVTFSTRTVREENVPAEGEVATTWEQAQRPLGA